MAVLSDEIFSDWHWGKCLELLTHLCHYGDQIIVVYGPKGVGKTTMLQLLQEQEADYFNFVVLNAAMLLTADVLAERVTIREGAKPEVLLIDDAQLLSMDVLAALLQLRRTSTRSSLQIVLFTDEHWLKVIRRSVLAQEFLQQVRRIELEPLSLLELPNFVQHVLHFEADGSVIALDKVQLKKIYDSTGGIPAEVRKMLKKFMTNKTTASTKESVGLSTNMVGAAVILGVLFCVLAILWPNADDNSLQPIVQDVALTTEPTGLVEPLPLENTASVDQADGLVDIATTKAEVQPEGLSEQNANQQSVAVTTQVEVIQPATIAPPLSAVTEQDELSDDAKIARLEQKLQALQEQLRGEQEARRNVEQKLQRKDRNNGNAKTKVESKVSKNGYSRAEQRMLAISSKHYAVQLLGSSNESKVKQFIKENSLTGKCNYYKTRYRGQAWYVVIYGDYPSRTAAQAALQRLPANVRKVEPWVRGYADIHKSIKRTHG